MIDNSYIYSNKINHDINHFSINFILILCKNIVENSYIVATQCFELIKKGVYQICKEVNKISKEKQPKLLVSYLF